MLNFQPNLSDEQIKKMGLMPEGQYRFKVLDAIARKSKSGNSMIELVLHVYNHHEKTSISLKDYLLTTDKRMLFKLKHFCHATGLNQKFDQGKLDPEDCKDKTGIVQIGIQAGAQRDDGSFYDDKNSVVDYLIEQPLSSVPEKDFNDPIPF